MGQLKQWQPNLAASCCAEQLMYLMATMLLALQEAFKGYLRARDYCATSKHILSMCLSVIRVNIAMSNFMNVSNYVQKAETTPDLSVQPPWQHVSFGGIIWISISSSIKDC